MINNASMPRCTINPVLGYADVRRTVQWLARTFGLEERLRIADHRAQLGYGDGDLVVTQSYAPAAGSHSVMFRVADVDAHCMQSKQAGATILREPETLAYGERQYSVSDIGGHAWTFPQSVADIDPTTWDGTVNDS